MAKQYPNEFTTSGKLDVEYKGFNIQSCNPIKKEDFINISIKISDDCFIRVYKPEDSEYVQIDIKGANELKTHIHERQKERYENRMRY